MALFYLGKLDQSQQFNIDNQKIGYKISGNLKFKSFGFSNFHKLGIDNDNFLAIDDDFVATTGSLIYDGQIGLFALKAIYNNYNGDVPSLRKHLIGNYALIIKKGDEITIFGEEYYVYDIYWYNKNGVWGVSNDLYSFFKYNRDYISINQNNILQRIYLSAILDNETEFNDVYRLSGDQKLVLDIKQDKLIIEKVSVKWKQPYQNYEDSVGKISDALIKVGSIITNVYPTHSICMTGGLDSRMYLASLLANKAKPLLLYGKGNSLITNTHHEDYDICKLYSEKYGLHLKQMDWSTPIPIDKYWNDFLNRYGLLSMTYDASDKLFEGFENNSAVFVTFGYFGELYRNVKELEDVKNLTFDIFINDYYLKKGSAETMIPLLCYNYADFVKTIKVKYEKVLFSKTGHTSATFQPEDNICLMQEYRARADSQMLNFANRICNCIYILSQYDVLSNANVFVEEMRNCSLMLSVLKRTYPSILEIPFFTHQHRMIYSEKKNIIEEPKFCKIRHMLGGFLPLLLKAKLMGFNSRTNNEEAKEFQHSIDKLLKKYMIGKYPQLSLISNSNLDLRGLLDHCMFENMFSR